MQCRANDNNNNNNNNNNDHFFFLPSIHILHVWIGSLSQKHRHDATHADVRRGGEMKRRLFRRRNRLVNVGAVLDEKTGGEFVAARDGLVKETAPVAVRHIETASAFDEFHSNALAALEKG